MFITTLTNGKRTVAFNNDAPETALFTPSSLMHFRAFTEDGDDVSVVMAFWCNGDGCDEVLVETRRIEAWDVSGQLVDMLTAFVEALKTEWSIVERVPANEEDLYQVLHFCPNCK